MAKQRALTILNEHGDQTLVWDEASDDMMEAIIEEKMKAGIQFFIIEARFFGLLPPKKTPLTDAAEARKHRALSIKDEQFAAFVAAGSGDVVKTPDAPVNTVRKAKSAKEVATSQSVGVKQNKGG